MQGTPTHLFRLCRLRPRWFGLGAVLLPVFAVAWLIGDTFLEDNNFRVVSADLFRSGQLRLEEWQESLDEHPYRSVLNLRGRKAAAPWYGQERAFSAEHGLSHFDLKLSSDIAPTAEQMDRLVATMRDAPKPLLIHCKEGADRSGLAAALYQYAIEGRPAEAAQRQLSLWYGHFPWLGSGTSAMETAFTAYVDAHPAPETEAGQRLPAV